MKKIILFIFLSFQLHLMAQQWEVVGNSFGNVANGAISGMEFQPESNTPYVAYPDAIEKNYAVRKWENESWVLLGETFGQTDLSGNAEIAMAFHPTSHELYVAYPDYTLYGFIVQKYNETTTSWESVGTVLGNITGIPGVDIAFHPTTNELHLVYPDTELNTFLVQKHNGTSWEAVGTTIGDITENGKPTIAFHPITNELYIGHVDYETLNIFVNKYDGTTWQQQGEGIHATNNNAQIAINFNTTNGTAYLAFPHLGGDNYHVRDFDGTSWPLMSYLGATSDYSTGVDMDFDSATERLYAAYLVYNKIEVQYYDGTDWTILGEQITSSGEDAGIVIRTNPNTSEPYLLFRDNDTNKYIVYKYNSGLSLSEENTLITHYSQNPHNDLVHITLAENYKNVKLEIMNLQGQLIQEDNFENVSMLETEIKGAAGIYMIKLSISTDEFGFFKLIKH